MISFLFEDDGAGVDVDVGAGVFVSFSLFIFFTTLIFFDTLSFNFDDSTIIDDKFSLISLIIFTEVLKRSDNNPSPFLHFFVCGLSNVIFIMKFLYVVIRIHKIFLRQVHYLNLLFHT